MKKTYLFHEAVIHLKEDLTSRKPAQCQSHIVFLQPETGTSSAS